MKSHHYYLRGNDVDNDDVDDDDGDDDDNDDDDFIGKLVKCYYYANEPSTKTTS